MSPRAAWRLESLGFRNVFDYAAGKSDWKARGLPTEGEGASEARPGSIARRVPTCRVDDRLGDVKTRVGNDGMCIVTTENGVVLGRLRAKQLAADPESLVGDVMEDGPTTVHYDESLPGLAERMAERNVRAVVVTDPDGKLIGVMHLEDAAQAIHEHHHH
ncbi:MAG: CBS domain-containing protein [Actinomycetota bacterium]